MEIGGNGNWKWVFEKANIRKSSKNVKLLQFSLFLISYFQNIYIYNNNNNLAWK